MLHRRQDYHADLRPELYSKYQHQDRRSSSSSASSSASSGSRYPTFPQTSRRVLANALQQNWDDHFSNQTEFDDSLTNLNWLHNVDPNKINAHMSSSDKTATSQTLPPLNAQLTQHRTGTNPFITIRSPAPPDTVQSNQLDYRNNRNLKPPFSYAILISWAMKELCQSKITLADIYNWIVGNFAYYRHADSSWQNSIRHNLSLGKCFEKVPRRKDEPGKGGFWRISAQHVKTLEMNLAKIKYDPCKHHITEHTSQHHLSDRHRQQNEHVYRSTPTSSTPVKRSRKSPLTVTQEDWDSPDSFSYARSESDDHGMQAGGFLAFNDGPLEDEDCNLHFDLSPFDTSSSDSNQYCPSTDRNISMHNFDGGSLDDILDMPMMLDKEDQFRLNTSNGDFSDYFNTSKDDLHELNCLLGIF